MTTNKTIIILTIIAALTIATNAAAGWLYLVPDFNYFGYRDREGVLHASQADAARYDSRTPGLSSLDPRPLAECWARRRSTNRFPIN
jgi:hypothetical protein